MNRHYPQPTIIGSGLTGLLISLALSKAEIEHVLIGGPPPVGSPRLGESLNIEATMYFLAVFPELADCYYEKAHAVVFADDVVGRFHFSFLQELQYRFPLEIWNKQAPDGLIHFDRVHLDAAIFDKATSSPYCTRLDARVAQIQCAPGSDRIEELVLQDGTAIRVSHVFDATGYIRLVARQLNVQRRMLGVTQHVVHAHYFRRPDAIHSMPDATWRHGTNNIRLYREVHGVDAMAWCIPLGDTVSVGVTTPAKGERPSDEALLNSVHDAFASYGVTYLDECDTRSRLGTAKMEFYTHARTHGANWLLTSAAHTQVWWPTSGGVDTSVAAAHAAVPFLKQPQAVGNRYQRYLAPLIRSQELWNWATSHRLGDMSDERMTRFGNQLMWSISLRMFHSLTLEKQDALPQTAASLAARYWGNEIWSRRRAPVSVSRLNY